jgi:hypothetical protein
MSFFEDIFEGLQRRGHGRHHDDGHHEHDQHEHEHGSGYGYGYDRDHDHHAQGGWPGGTSPSAMVASVPCPSCKTVVPMTPGARYCASCGGALAEPTCAGCGSRLAPGAAFCQRCGTRV